MVTLDGGQLALLDEVAKAYRDLEEPLKELQKRYRITEFRMKRKVIQAVENARDAKVPLARILKEMGEVNYPAALERWMTPPEGMEPGLEEVEAGFTDDDAEEALNAVEALAHRETPPVVRDARTGMLTVLWDEREYKVLAMGPESDLWASREDGTAQEVYDLIKQTYPSFVVLDDDDDDI